jgi:hypothetical protein
LNLTSLQNHGSKGRIAQSYINPHTGFMTSIVRLQVGLIKLNLHMKIGNKIHVIITSKVEVNVWRIV